MGQERPRVLAEHAGGSIGTVVQADGAESRFGGGGVLPEHLAERCAEPLQRFVGVGRGARERRRELDRVLGGGVCAFHRGLGLAERRRLFGERDRGCHRGGGGHFRSAAGRGRRGRRRPVTEPVIHDHPLTLRLVELGQAARRAPRPVHLAQVADREGLREARDDLVRADDLVLCAFASFSEIDLRPHPVEDAVHPLVFIQREARPGVLYGRLGTRGASTESGFSGVRQRITRRISFLSDSGAELYV